METEYLGRKKGKVGIKVFDDNGGTHKVEIGLDGELIFHGTDDYPHRPADRNQEERRITNQVEARAQYAAQQEFPEEDILPFEWHPDKLEKVVTAIQQHPDDEFERDFRAFYDAIQHPPVDRPREEVDLVIVGVRLDDAHEHIEHVTEPIVGFREDGEVEMRGPHADVACHLTLNSPVYEFDWAFGPQFREFLALLAKCHVRDAYLHMGENPPEEYMVKGHGKIRFFGMQHYDDVRFPDL
ncbi:hypothetical protein [Halorubellus sp. PRR65]|uniref:hypothetical protein n=1 Tax=Halorubellus sp. PRR65 TaxID=3098148 RepID=UPI002B26079C|nr:hypothetical protein [Halorubellus sp. PRR65]